MTRWLREHKFEAHLGTFTMMILASIGLYLTMESGSDGLIILLIVIFVTANLVAMLVK